MKRSLKLAGPATITARRARLLCATAAVVLIGLGTASAQTYKMTTPFAPGVAVPDKIESSIGTLNLNYGYPSADTVDKIYDNLDRSRALQAYLLAIPIVNQAGMRDSMRKFGPDNQTDVIWENLVDPKTVELTANDNTIYNFMWVDTSKGPLVAEIPPKVLGMVDDFWYKWVADIGITGADKGEGGKYLLLPPGFKGDIPAGYHVLRPSTFGSYLVFRAFVVDGSTQPGGRLGQEEPADLSPGRGRQPAADEVRQCLRHSIELRRTGRLLVLEPVEPGHPGRAGGRFRSHHLGPVRLDRHRQGPALQSR